MLLKLSAHNLEAHLTTCMYYQFCLFRRPAHDMQTERKTKKVNFIQCDFQLDQRVKDYVFCFGLAGSDTYRPPKCNVRVTY